VVSSEVTSSEVFANANCRSSLDDRGRVAQTFDFSTTKPALQRRDRLRVGGGVQGDGAGGCLTSAQPPFCFSVKAPQEANYTVTVKLGDSQAATVSTVKAELRRLMLERVRTVPAASKAAASWSMYGRRNFGAARCA
jgi:hypothetical protein